MYSPRIRLNFPRFHTHSGLLFSRGLTTKHIKSCRVTLKKPTRAAKTFKRFPPFSVISLKNITKSMDFKIGKTPKTAEV